MIKIRVTRGGCGISYEDEHGTKRHALKTPEDGPFMCELSGIEVMGRDISVLSSNKASVNPTVRAIIGTENNINIEKLSARFALAPHKVFLFDKETERKIEPNGQEG